MSKSEFIRARVEPKLKVSAGRVLKRVGVSTTDAITMFLRQVVIQGGLPFEVRVPNAETRKAIAELEAGKGERFEGSTKELFDEFKKGRQRRRA
jgi:DNA-damage-inducible protein J